MIDCPSCRRPLPQLPGHDDYPLIEIADLIRSRELILAIKRVRELTGAGLKEAKDYIDCPHAPLPGRPVPSASPGAPPFAGDAVCPDCHRPLPPVGEAPSTTPAEIARILQQGAKIEAVKRVRELCNVGLREAKDYIDCPHRAIAARPPTLTDANVLRLATTDSPAQIVLCPLCSNVFPDAAPAGTRALIAQHLKGGNLLLAIRTVRESTGWGLKEAKDYAECPHRVPR